MCGYRLERPYQCLSWSTGPQALETKVPAGVYLTSALLHRSGGVPPPEYYLNVGILIMIMCA